MFSFFLNPWTMVAGGALVASPIIIHLINRMRFKRVRWAAMEFLLKSQKRARRKLIIEQLILLLLRILAILLFGVLLARFLGFSPDAPSKSRGTLHVVIVDDSASMGDAVRRGGAAKSAFDAARDQVIEEIARPASLADTPQFLRVVRTSDITEARDFERVTSATPEAVAQYLASLEPTAAHHRLLPALDRAAEILADAEDVETALHIVSDFRAADWAGPDRKDLTERFAKLGERRTGVHLIDVADPARPDADAAPAYHGNLGILAVRPESRLVGQYREVEFAVEVANFSEAEQRDVGLDVQVNGAVPAGLEPVSIAAIPPRQTATARFRVRLERTGRAEDPAARFNLVAVSLKRDANPQSGLAADNTRYEVVEVVQRLPVLLVEGDRAKRADEEPDTLRVEAVLNLFFQGVAVEVVSPERLSDLELGKYYAVVLANVKELDEGGTKNLAGFVRDGGGAAFFLGPNSNAEFYNQLNEDGLFPVKLAARPSKRLSDRRVRLRRRRGEKNLVIREPSHPALRGLLPAQSGGRPGRSYFASIIDAVVPRQYFPPAADWSPRPNEEVLLSFTNRRPMADYRARTGELLDRLDRQLAGANFRQYRPGLGETMDRVRGVAASAKAAVYDLAEAIDAMLRAGPEAEGEPDPQKFWQAADVKPLREAFERLRVEARYGDPLYAAGRPGRGRVLAMLTSANSDWNDLNSAAGYYFPLLIVEMQGHLAAGGAGEGRPAGTAFRFERDANAYKSRVDVSYLGGETEGGARKAKPLGAESMDRQGEAQTLLYPAEKPGVYLFRFERADADSAGSYRAAAVNVDVEKEGDLKRASRPEILTAAPGADLRSAEDRSGAAEIDPEIDDWSKHPWIYLALLGVLLAEQAMAVRLSYHTKGAETDR